MATPDGETIQSINSISGSNVNHNVDDLCDLSDLCAHSQLKLQTPIQLTLIVINSSKLDIRGGIPTTPATPSTTTTATTAIYFLELLLDCSCGIGLERDVRR